MADKSLTLQLKGADAFIQALGTVGELAKQEIANALNKGINDAERTAKLNVPHKSGKLSGSLHAEYATPGNLVAKYGTNVEYARAQEYGTKGMIINVPNGREIKKGSGIYTRPYSFKGNIEGKHYMQKGFDEAKSNLGGYMEIATKHIIQHLATK